MGNCLRNNKISAQEFELSGELDKTQTEADEETKKSAVPESKTAARREESKKKTVRFKLNEDERSEPVRIRLVVTREELRRILKYENNTSLEQLLKASGISEVGKDGDGVTVNPAAWRPSLKSIPEERSVK